jgi:hypothetical protein
MENVAWTAAVKLPFPYRDRAERAAWLTKPPPPACSEGNMEPEYFMTPPSTERLQNWTGYDWRGVAQCSPKVNQHRETEAKDLFEEDQNNTSS